MSTDPVTSPAPAPLYTLDDEPVDLDVFLRDNAAPDVAGFSDEDLAAIRALRPGEEIVLGGGAGAEFVLRRTR
jgi:hypothetical protein